MDRTIKAVFDKHLGKHLVFDRKLLKKILQHVASFETRDEDHINFLGGNLLGVVNLHYNDGDVEEWIDDILDVDDWEELVEDYHDLPEVEKSFAVSGSTINMSFVYLAHMALTSKHLSASDRERGATAVFIMLQYRFLSSLVNHFFPYPYPWPLTG